MPPPLVIAALLPALFGVGEVRPEVVGSGEFPPIAAPVVNGEPSIGDVDDAVVAPCGPARSSAGACSAQGC